MTFRIGSTFLLFLSLTFCRLQVFGQNQNAFITDSLDQYIQQALQSWRIPGVAVCVVKDGKLLVQKGYGVRDWNTKTRVDEKTVFPIASISKTFTGTLFATLEADGKLSTNDLVKKWFPQFTMRDKQYEQQLMLSDVLSHRSGWKTFQGDLLNTETALSYSKMIQIFGMQKPAYPIRTRFGYSNFGFLIAGECVKKITQKTWNEYMQARLLLPLGMKRTFVFDDDIRNEVNKVVGHTLHNDSLVVLPPDKIEPYSHGGMFSSIEDLGIWMKALLNKGNLDDKNVIPESAISKMWLSNTIIGKSKAADQELYFKTYGLGWEIMQYQKVEVMQHNGAYSGALTSLALVPSLNLGVAILSNSDNHLLHETIKWQMIDAFLQRIVPNYTLNTIKRQKSRKRENSNLLKENKVEVESFATDLNALVGTYVCDYYGKAFINKDKNDYVLTLEHHPQLRGVFSPYQKDQLICTYNHPMFGKVKLPFVVVRSKVKAFELFVDGFIEADGYEFRKVK